MVGGVPETILENVTGWTIRNDAPDEWVEKIGQLIESPELRSKFGRAGRKWVAENFSWQKIAGQVENLVLGQIDS
jgi:phosphatidylinositol alpha-1,6-mannosyltransferase